MKRELLCRECALKVEADHKKYGASLGSFSCDTCNEGIEKNEIACAVTMLTPGESVHTIHPWWDEYVSQVPKQ